MGVRAVIAPPAVAVPGSPASGTVRVENDSTEGAAVVLAVAGPAAGWAEIVPASLELAPGGSAEARLVVRAPRSPAVAAGPVPVVVEVRSGAGGAPVATAEAQLEVAPFVDVVARMASPTVAGRRRARFEVVVQNRGNAPARAAVGAVDPDEALFLAVHPAAVDVDPGGVATVTVEARPQSRFLLGPTRPRPFTVAVTPAGGRPAQVGAAFDQQPCVPRSAFAAVGTLVAVGLAASLLGGGWTSPAPPPDTDAIAALPDDRPDPACIGRDHLAIEGDGGSAQESDMPVSWSFLKLAADGCTPVRFDPCRPVHYVTSGPRGPADDADLSEALRRVAEATGIEFVHDGEVPDDPGLPARSFVGSGPGGRRWAPVHIAWVGSATIGRARGQAPPPPPGDPRSTATTVPDIGIPGAGLPVESGGVYVTGLLLLNVDAVADLRTRATMPNGFGRGPNWGRVLLHELGHLLGLGHVRSTANLMHHHLGAQTSPTAAFGTGDRIALGAVGRQGGCVETPAP